MRRTGTARLTGRTRWGDGADGADESRGAGAAGGELADSEEPGTAFSGRPWVDLDEVPGPVAELLLSVRTPRARRQLERLISAAELDRTGPVDPVTAARMVRPYSWLLDRVGDDGIKLTDAGHLPPAEVAAVIDELNLAAEGITRVSRENQAPTGAAAPRIGPGHRAGVPGPGAARAHRRGRGPAAGPGRVVVASGRTAAAALGRGQRSPAGADLAGLRGGPAHRHPGRHDRRDADRDRLDQRRRPPADRGRCGRGDQRDARGAAAAGGAARPARTAWPLPARRCRPGPVRLRSALGSGLWALRLAATARAAATRRPWAGGRG